LTREEFQGRIGFTIKGEFEKLREVDVYFMWCVKGGFLKIREFLRED
jgi:hypothetical protein